MMQEDVCFLTIEFLASLLRQQGDDFGLVGIDFGKYYPLHEANPTYFDAAKKYKIVC